MRSRRSMGVNRAQILKKMSTAQFQYFMLTPQALFCDHWYMHCVWEPVIFIFLYLFVSIYNDVLTGIVPLSCPGGPSYPD